MESFVIGDMIACTNEYQDAMTERGPKGRPSRPCQDNQSRQRLTACKCMS